jgi:undecaprenyl-phosphate galactose phosphotransferase
MNNEVSYISGENIGLFYWLKHHMYLVIKRVFDIFCSIIGCVFLIPLAIIIKITYIITGDFKSIFFVQKRIGKKGKIFYLYKFRTMVPNSEEVLKELLKDPKYQKEWKKNQKLENDPRITKIGKILRKTSLDELPQMINVFIGDMSMIGPRPLVEGELDAHNGNHQIYESVCPGISGWWAANGRSATTYEKRLELEYYYCKNCNLWLDIKCIFRTIKAVIYKTGAK